MDEKEKTQNAAGAIIPDLYDRIKAAADDFDQGKVDDLTNILYTLIKACGAANVSVIATAAITDGAEDMAMTGGHQGRVSLNMGCLSEIMGRMLEGQPPHVIELTLRVFLRDLAEHLPFVSFEVDTRQADGPRKKGS